MHPRPTRNHSWHSTRAFDRRGLRYGPGEDRILDDIARAMSALGPSVGLKYYSHHEADEQALPALRRRGLDFEVVRLSNVSGREILRRYSEPTVVIGMRGHAQLIPFGCRRPIVSLASHDKMWFFLDDVNSRDWGVDVRDPALAEKLLTITTTMLDDLPAAEARVAREAGAACCR